MRGDDGKLRCAACDELKTQAPKAFVLRPYQQQCVNSIFETLGISNGQERISGGADGNRQDGSHG